MFSWGTNHQKLQPSHQKPSCKNRINVDCLYRCLHLLLWLFVHFWFVAKFLSNSTKALIKLLIKHLFVCFDLTEKSSRKKVKEKENWSHFIVTLVSFLSVLARKGKHCYCYFEEHTEYNITAKEKTKGDLFFHNYWKQRANLFQNNIRDSSGR